MKTPFPPLAPVTPLMNLRGSSGLVFTAREVHHLDLSWPVAARQGLLCRYPPAVQTLLTFVIVISS